MRRGLTIVRISARALLAGTLLAAPSTQAAEQAFEESRQVRSILSNHCFACHGPDQNKRKAKLRLDTLAGATAHRDGHPAVVPGLPEQSELILRIFSEDPDERMPPSDQPKQLSEAHKRLLVDWIRAGAPWPEHWAFVPPKRPDLPRARRADAPAHPIDAFVLARLEREGLKPSPRAGRRTLLRRLSFDLTGLPPAPEEVESFENDDSPGAYLAQVNRLLASPHYGERLAMHWLDLVRYADTVGYHGDQTQNIWPYRDYVIRAFNDSKPFDQFTIEQLAGDLLPHPSLEQKVASGYNRLNMTTEEGGAQDKEYLIKYAADRVRATSSVWMGATLGCAECHDHKYDPYTAKDFYRFAAFFADLQEIGAYPGGNGKRPPEMLVPTPTQAERLAELQAAFDRTDQEFEALAPSLVSALAEWEEKWSAQSSGVAAERPKLPDKIVSLLKVPADKRSKDQQRALIEWFAGSQPAFAPIWNRREHAKKELDQYQQQIPLTMVSVSVRPRVTRVLPRGNWLDESGEVVEPGVPRFLDRDPPPEGRATRLELARWFVRPDNPLTARVFVNRLWELFFGAGLSKVLDDLGAQGEAPTHPELLDWLAVEFMEHGWDIKHLVRLIVTSETYQQSSLPPPGLAERDPLNRLLARQARFRLPAEMVRDNALAVSGLLVRDLGGRSVKPYQPADYWVYLNFPKRDYVPDTGRHQYRRGLYTHWQRLFLHPSLMAFDAPSREECTAERPVSNTPLAALALLNDPSYVEAARALAELTLEKCETDSLGRIDWIFQRALNRSPRPDEAKQLVDLLAAESEHYRAHPALARELVHVGLKPVAADLEVAELAAWTAVCRAVLNLHETIVRF